MSSSRLPDKPGASEMKYDAQFKAVLDAIRELMEPPELKRHPIGFKGPGTQ